MIKRILLFGLLATVIQITFYFLFLKLIQFVQTITITDIHREYISNYGIELSVVIFTVILIVQNITTALINKKWFTWTALTLVTIFYLIGWGEGLNSWPVKTVLFLLVGILTLISKFSIDKNLTRW